MILTLRAGLNRPMRRIAALLCGILLGTAVFAVSASYAVVKIEGPRIPAPNFPTAKIWINSKPLTLKQLRGKVVLIDFWDYTCINCIRTFPHLERWYRLYGPLGLVIIGVHTPEFDFAKNVNLVRDAVKRFGITYPVAIDNDGEIWDAFHNPGWPTEYLLDSKGRVVERHLGEGDYDLTEMLIQSLLKEANPSLSFKAAKYRVAEDEQQYGGACLRTTRETYLGTLRSLNISNKGGLVKDKLHVYVAPRPVPLDTAALEGPWTVHGDGIHTDASAGKSDSEVLLHYRAKSVYMVAGSDNGTPRRVYITQDGKPLAQSARGLDVKADASGKTYLELGQRRMYYVVNNRDFGKHLLTVSTTDSGVGLYSFTFGNNCEPDFAHK